MVNTASVSVQQVSIEGNKRIVYGTVIVVSDGSNYATGGVAVAASADALRKALRLRRQLESIDPLGNLMKADLTTGYFFIINPVTFKIVVMIADPVNGDLQEHANAAALAANTYIGRFMARGV